jgi:hypothetical protein
VGTLGVAATAASKDLVGLETFAKELARQQLTLSWLSSTLSTHHAAAGRSGEELQEALVSRAKAAGILTIDVTAEVQARQKQPQTPSGTHTFTKEDPARRERKRQLQDLLTTLEHEDAMSLMQKINNAKNPEQQNEVGKMVDTWMESQSKKGLFDPDGKNSVKSEAWLAYEREQAVDQDTPSQSDPVDDLQDPPEEIVMEDDEYTPPVNSNEGGEEQHGMRSAAPAKVDEDFDEEDKVMMACMDAWMPGMPACRDSMPRADDGDDGVNLDRLMASIAKDDL